ncbi:hypothetical protein HK107_14135 [Parvularcula sp. ZS-1/3]|uniref:Uncharacterized protein n=1 Tax=Parvularcula mediterranea TaxID=2732508 RepID=A0A7Y3W6F0_9PROT|nr:DUF6445 family protein [Parvularcula mediterranea]NNU17468.1 hypothetical protein [Parvularcula mediterranea]
MQQPPDGIIVHRHGREQQPVVVIDDFVPYADQIMEFASKATFGESGAFFPGVRAQFDPGYLRGASEALKYATREVFGIKSNPAVKQCYLSYVTTPPAALKPEQRRAHYDTSDPNMLAILHYLCDEEDGGTSFYRHRATGFETVPQERSLPLLKEIDRETEAFGEPAPGYLNGDTEQFERIASYKAKFNRAIIYRSMTLHSGDISNDRAFTTDIKTGRLTVNSFVTTA